MNKNCYRVIFNRARGALMVVQENGLAPHAAGGRRASGALVVSAILQTTRRPIALAAMLLLGVPAIAMAQIVAAPGSGAHVIQTQNGLPQVDVARPSGAGVSVNTYSQFDVQRAGAILNNSPTIVQTRQAGYINGNPNFGANDAARIIVNQVNGNNPSQLRGFVEVAGQRADVVIANPSGLVVDGGGFINTSRATLTTEIPFYGVDGSLAGFNVNRGLVTVVGSGLNASGVDRVDLIARAVEANAAIYANHLNVVMGANQVNHDTLATSRIQGEGAVPAVALDIGQLGGMYANRIFLVGTEGGVGVRNAGTIVADAMGLTLTTEGRLVQAGTISAFGNVAVSAAGGIENTGTTYSQQSVSLNTGADMANSGTLAAQHHVGVNAGSVDSTGSIGAGVDSDGVLTQAGELQLTTAGRLSATGRNLAGGNATLKGSAVNLAGSTTAASGNLSMTSTTGDVNLTNATTSAQGSVTVNAAGALVNDYGKVSGQQDVNATSGSISNVGGTLESQGAMQLQTGAFSNSQGTVQSGGALTVTGSTIDNSNGTLTATQIGLVAGALSNAHGVIQARNELKATAAGAISNQGGKLESLSDDGTLSVTGASIDNTSGRIVNAGTGTTQIDAGTQLINTGGTAGGNGDVAVHGASIMNTAKGQLVAGDNLTFGNANQIVNDGGNLTAGGTLSMHRPTSTFSNVGGTVNAAHVNLDTARLDNTDGQIGNLAGSPGNVSVQTGTLTNPGGAITSTQDLIVTAGVLMGDGRLTGGRDTTVSLQGNYTNDAANLITANRHLTFSTTGQLTNTGRLASAGNMTINANGIVNQAGAMLASGNPGDDSSGMTTLDAGPGDIDNAGSIDGNAVTTSGNILTNTGAIIGGTLTHTAGTIVNDGAKAVIAGANQVNLYASETLTSQHGATIVSLGDINIARDGQKDANDKLVNQTGTVNNLSSTIEAGGQLNVAANQLNNVRQDIQTQTDTSSSTSTMSELPWWTPQNANIVMRDAYYLNPADIVSITPVVTPDGFVVQKVVANLPSSVSAFQWRQSGLTYSQPNGGSRVEFQKDSRLTPAASQVVLYAYSVQTGQSNPDHAGGTAWPQFSKTTTDNQQGTTTYSNQYGNCTSACTRIETYPQYTDPTTLIQKDTEQRRGGSGPGSYPVEVERIATRTVAQTTLSPASGAAALLTSGAAMNLAIGTQLNNDNGTIAAGGDLRVNDQAVLDDGSHAMIRNTSTQLSTTYSFQNSSGYGSPWASDPTAPAQWTTWTRPSITLPTGIAGGTITSNKTVTIDAGSIVNTSVPATTGPTGASAVVLGLTAATLAGGQSTGPGGAIRTVDGARTTMPNLALPPGGLFTLVTAPEQPYAVVTDPRFTRYSSFISSDYMLSQLGLDPGAIAKRLGDGYYESQLVMNQITNLTGKRYLAGHSSNEAGYRQLMTNGAVFARQFGLAPGIALTDAQMAALTTDIVWLVNQTVTLPDGSEQTALVPQVYLSKPGNLDLSPTGALIAGDAVALKARDILNQGATVAGTRDTVLLASNDIQNLGGTISGDNLALVAGRDIVNQSITGTETTHFATGTSTHTSIAALGQLTAGSNLMMQAGNDIDVRGARVSAGQNLSAMAGNAVNVGTVATGSSVSTQTDARNTRQQIDTAQVGSVLQTGGNLGVTSGGDIGITGSTLKSGGDMLVAGSGNVTIQAAKDSTSTRLNAAAGKNWSVDNRTLETGVGSQLSAGGSATVLAGVQRTSDGMLVLPEASIGEQKNLAVTGSGITAGTNGTGNGAVSLGASGDVTIAETRTRADGNSASHAESRNPLSRRSTDSARSYAGDNANGSLVSGDSVSIHSGKDINVTGSAVVGTGDVSLDAARRVNILAAEDRNDSSAYYDRKRSGLMGSGGLGFTIGSTQQKAQSDNHGVQQSQRRSAVGSVQGNVSIKAGENVHIGGSDVIAGKAADDPADATGNIRIAGQKVTIDPGQDDARAHDQQESKSRGFTAAITGTPFDAVRNVRDNASSGNGFQRAHGVVTEAGASMLDVPSIALTYGRSESSSVTDRSSRTNAGSAIRGAGNVTVIATGGSERDTQGHATDGDITVVGSSISAGGKTLLDANRRVTLAASTDQYQQNTHSSSSSTSLALLSLPSLGNVVRWISGTANNDGVGLSPYNASRENSDGNLSGTRQTATVVSGDSVTIRGRTGDVNVIGSGVSGTHDVRVTADQGAVNVLAGLETNRSHEESSSRRIGNLGSNGTSTGFSVGVSNSHSVQDSANQTQGTMRSQIASASGNVTLDAKKDLTVTGSDLMTSKDLKLQGENLHLDSGTDRTQNSMSQHASQFGVSLALGGAVGNAMSAVNQTTGNPPRGDDARLGALDKTQAALTAYNATKVAQAFDAGKSTAQPLVKATASVGGGVSSSESRSSALANAGSTLTASGKVSLIATGSGAKDADGFATDGDIDARGTRISGRNVVLDAARDINLQSAKDTTQMSNWNSSSGGSIGIGANLGGQQNGFTLELAASAARGNVSGQSVMNRDTVVSAGDTLTVKSGRDTSLRGAQAMGNRVVSDVGRDLNIESQQDTATYESRQTGAGLQMSVCVPPFCLGQTVNGSVNVSQQNIRATFASVNRQSGIFAGDGGYEVNVGNHTQLDGGAIAATAGGDRNSFSTQSFGYTDIENRASHSGSAVGFSASGGVGNSSSKGINLNTPVTQAGAMSPGPVTANGLGPGGFSVAGTGSDVTGTTYATVNPGSITVRGDAGTGHDSAVGLNRDMSIANGAVQNTFDARKVQNDLAVQQAAGQVGMQMVGEVGKHLTDKAAEAVKKASDGLTAAQASGDAAAISKAQAELDTANRQYAMWNGDSASRVGAHSIVSAAAAALGGGNVAGAVVGTVAGDYAGAAVGQMAGNTLGGTLLTNLVTGAAGAVAGGVVGGVSGAMSGAGGALSADLYNRQLHPDERQWIRDNAAAYAKQQDITLEQAVSALTAQADRQVQNGSSGAWDRNANAFLGQAHGMLPADGNSGLGYMFYATPEQKANADVYAGYYPDGAGMNRPTAGDIANSVNREAAYRDAYAKGTLASAAGAGLIAGGPAIAALPGVPILGAEGALGSGAMASPMGTGIISAGINASSQYAQDGKINPVDVVSAFATGTAGSYGKLWWNVGLNTIGGITTTTLNDILYGKNESVIGSGISSGVLSALGYGAGKVIGDGINSIMKPTVNNLNNWTGPGVWSSSGYNIFRPNNSATMGATFGGGVVQEALKNAIEHGQSSEGGK
ncbi:hemagglutinin repeat-containing protein [Paraburkholderia megapolitana]|uniref:hemagglutinin repeat-containing protein n=1 Tax=Paraburkholderia megapolitana TaxID=420953 RepID=UPI0038BDA5E5